MILETLADLRHLPKFLTELRSPRVWPSQHVSQSGGWNWMTDANSATGLVVDETTALANTALWRGLQLITGVALCVAPVVHKKGADGRYERAENHWLWRLLHEEPNSEMTAEVFIQTQYLNKLVYGARYAEIVRDAAGRPTALWHIPSWLVRPVRLYKRAGGGLTEYVSEATPEDRGRGGELLFEVKNGTGKPIYLTQLEVLHVPGMSFNGILGIRPIPTHRETVGIGLAMQGSAAAIFGNTSGPSVVIERPLEAPSLDPDGERARLAAWEASQRGIPRRGRAAIAQEGEEVKVLDLKLHELQFVENIKNNVPEVARILNLDAYWLGHDGTTNTYANVESRWRDLLLTTMLPHFKLDRAEIWRKLVPATEAASLTIRHNLKELLEPDSATRQRIQRGYLEMGVTDIDEIARQEGMPGVSEAEGGKVRWMAPGLRPLDQALRAPAPPPPPPATKPPTDDEPVPPPKADDDGDDERAAGLRRRLAGMVEAAMQRAVTREVRELRKSIERLAPEGIDAVLARIDELYDRELPEVVERLAGPALGAAASTFGQRYSVGHRAELRARLLERDVAGTLALLDHWMSTAARDAAANEIDRLAI